MSGGRTRDVRQFGDFQTPPALASEVCAWIRRFGVRPSAILEPTCGRGAFLAAAAETFPEARAVLGFDVNPDYVEKARRDAAGTRIEVATGDFFRMDWPNVLARRAGRWLVLGNPPWVTNSALGALGSSNLPPKSNFQRRRGLDALTGKANFDISEWMLARQVEWLRRRGGWIAMLVKTSVARKILVQVWSRGDPVGKAAIAGVDAGRHFGASVDACLFVLPVSVGDPARECDVFDGLDSGKPSRTIGCVDDDLIADVDAFARHRDLVGTERRYRWRSGVKHDCSRVMELREEKDGRLVNGSGDVVEIEDRHLFPLLKGSDIANGRLHPTRKMVVTQRTTGESTDGLRIAAPRAWRYLASHGERLDARRSSIYRGRPRFSMFGVGRYAFAPWKVAISGLHKTFRFEKVGPAGGSPVVFDDTVYFVACESEAEADFVLTLVRSPAFVGLMRAMVHWSDKRPVTAGLLRRASLERVAESIGLADRYRFFAGSRRAETSAPARSEALLSAV